MKLDVEPSSGIKKRKLKRATKCRPILPRSKTARIAAMERTVAELTNLVDQALDEVGTLSRHAAEVNVEQKKTLQDIQRLQRQLKRITKEAK